MNDQTLLKEYEGFEHLDKEMHLLRCKIERRELFDTFLQSLKTARDAYHRIYLCKQYNKKVERIDERIEKLKKELKQDENEPYYKLIKQIIEVNSIIREGIKEEYYLKMFDKETQALKILVETFEKLDKI